MSALYSALERFIITLKLTTFRTRMSPLRLKIVSMLCLLLFGFPGFVPLQVTQAQQYGLRFNLDVVPSNVPADGGAYTLFVYLTDSAGNPAAAPSSLLVSLFSSDQRVGFVQPTVNIPFDGYFATATFTSTTTAGTTVITALAPGIQAGTLGITTTVPVGFPDRIVVYPLPSVLIPQGGEGGTLVVQLQDPTGKPARSPTALPVQLTSSDTNVASVGASVTIPVGSTYATAPYSTTNIPGTAVITATSPGYVSGSTTVTVSGPSPAAIQVSVLPRVMVADGLTTGLVVVSLTDPAGFPARAKTPIDVVLTSSNVSVAKFDTPSLTIPQGSFYAFKTIRSGGPLEGVTIITAQSSGLSAGFVTLVSRQAGLPAEGQTIDLTMGPPAVLPDGSIYPQIVCAQLLNQSDGYPVPASAGSPVTVYFSSSNTLYGSVSSQAQITNNSTYALADFTSTLLVGGTTITAAADGFAPAQKTIKSSAPPPAKIVLGMASSVLRATGDSYPLIYVQLQDLNGNPAKAPSDIQVSLISADPTVGTVDSSVIVQQGKSYAIAGFISTSSPGVANITASATGFEPTWALVRTVEPFPSVLAVYARPLTMVNDGSSQQAVVQLLDSEGRPAKPELPIQVFLTSDSPSVADVQNMVTMAAGASYASAPLALGRPGTAVITAIAQGYTSGSAIVTVSQLPMAISLNVTTSRVVVGRSYQVGLTAMSGQAPVGSAQVSASALSGQFTSATGLTDLNGAFSTQYLPKSPGFDNVTFAVTKAGFVTAAASLALTVDAYYTVTLTVVDEAGNPISGVKVSLSDSAGKVWNLTTDSGGVASFRDVFWGQATVTVPGEHQGASARYTFIQYSDGASETSDTVKVLSDLSLDAKFQTYYFVSATTPYGAVLGAGAWYPRGTTATVSVDPTSVPDGFFGLVSKKFLSWKGDVSAGTPSVQVTVDSNKNLQAEWGDDYFMLILVIAASTIVVVAVIGFIWFIRRRRAAAPAPEEEFK